MTDTMMTSVQREREPVLAGASHFSLRSVDGEPASTPAGQVAAAPVAGELLELAGYTFRRMTFSDAALAPSGDDASVAADALIREIHFPGITEPQTPASERFNALMEQHPNFERERLVNEVIDYEIAYAGSELISVRFDASSDAIGAAHPNGSASGVTVLMRDGQLLEAGDVFTVTSGWQDFVTMRAVEDIARQLNEFQVTPVAADVRETALDTRRWLITQTALILLFPAYSFGAPYVMGGAEVSIPWADLAPYLNGNAPAPIAH